MLVIAAHNGSHTDALCHVYSDGEMYNGFSKDTFASQNGAGRCGIQTTGGFATRAVLADIAGQAGVECLEPGYKMTGDEIEKCLAFARLSADGTAPPFAQPGLSLSCVDSIRDNDLAIVGADNAAIECIPFDEDRFLAVHIELLVKLAITLVEHLVLTPMATDKCYSALLVVAPMLVTGGSGSSVNPIAIV